eukprot:TRINITY_DN11344_c0_g3_i1.p1 TRINITY_DN11344_c0_g3~~TRINITY_DN11344_c0_g3_i1.p1  ORF type:complete len:234 (+),score=36.90 TRINITY_DN11344_c0_g3_i1:178-879(+)
MPGALDAAACCLPFVIAVLPWELYLLAFVCLGLVYCLDAVRGAVRAQGWVWEGKKVCVKGFGEDMRSVLMKSGAVVTDAGNDCLVLDGRVGAANAAKFEDVSEEEMQSALDVFPFSEIKNFVKNCARKEGPQAVVLVQDGYHSLVGHNGYPHTMAAWATFGFAEAIRAELHQTHPNVYFTTLHSSHPPGLADLVLHATHRHPRSYDPWYGAVARLLIMLPTCMQKVVFPLGRQ